MPIGMKRILSALLLTAAVPAAATVTGYFAGNGTNNANPGQLTDGSGNGRTLTLVGTVGNPTSPTVPEGANWLLGKPANGSYLSAPTTVFAPLQGMVEFYIRRDANFAAGNPFFACMDADGFGVLIGQGNATQASIANELAGGSGSVIFSTSVNTTYKIRVQYSGSSFEVFKDGVSQGTATYISNTVSTVELGGSSFSGLSITKGFVDAFQFGNSTSDVYIPEYTATATVTSATTPTYTVTPTVTPTPVFTPYRAPYMDPCQQRTRLVNPHPCL